MTLQDLPLIVEAAYENPSEKLSGGGTLSLYS